MKIVLRKVYIIQPKFSTGDIKSIFLIKYHYCVMENSLQNLVNVVKNALQQLIVAYLLNNKTQCPQGALHHI